MMEKIKSLSGEADVDTVLEKYKVDDLRNIEKKTRAEIERKKEELRSMVGERYREIIEAADSITDMKNRADQVKTSLKSMQDMHGRIQSLKILRTNKFTENQNKYSIAAQIKLLLDAPEWVWRCVESKQLLKATRLFVICNHVITCLRLSSDGSSVLARQASVVATLKPMLLDRLQSQLSSHTDQSQSASDLLCALVLLKDISPKQAVHQLLESRAIGVSELLSDSGSMSVKEQVCSVTKLITSTVLDVSRIAAAQESGGELVRLLNTVCVEEAAEKVLQTMYGSTALKYLPQIVRDYKPRLTAPITPLDSSDLREISIQWRDSTLLSVRERMIRLLQHVSSVKSLAGIRDEAWLTVQQSCLPDEWTKSCVSIFSESLDVWRSLLMPLFIKSAKEQVTKHLKEYFDLIQRRHGELASVDNQPSAADVLWTESPSDIPAGSTWLPRSLRLKIGDVDLSSATGLSAKAAAHLPDVCELCSTLEESLCSLQTDLLSYLHPPDVGLLSDDVRHTDNSAANEWEFHGGREELCKHLNTETIKQLITLLEYLQNSASELESSETCTNSSAAKLLLLCRLSRALHDLVPHLCSCVTLTHHQSSKASATSNSAWEPHRKRLVSLIDDLFLRWGCVAIQPALSTYCNSLQQDNSQLNLINTPSWTEVEIEEEGEDGEKRTSTIRIPSQASYAVQQLIFDVSHIVNQAAAHVLSKATRHALCVHVLKAVSDAMRDNIDEITQQSALQYSFDVRCLIETLTTSSSDIPDSTQRLLERLESVIDPFDLDVFTSHMRKALRTHIARSQVLCVLLSADERQSSLIVAAPRSTSHENPNVLAMTSIPQISLLPVPTTSATHKHVVKSHATPQPLRSVVSEMTMSSNAGHRRTGSGSGTMQSFLGSVGAFLSSKK